LSAKIDEGLSQSRFGVVIISRAFLDKHWPKKELAGLRAKEEHGVARSDVVRFSPTLADTLAGDTAKGIDPSLSHHGSLAAGKSERGLAAFTVGLASRLCRG
jgi:hypothetical protein